jgi:hypothetical protein
VTEETVDAQVIDFVRRARLATASEIARSLKLTRREVNSALYRGLNKYFEKTDDQPPHWTPRSNSNPEQTPRSSPELPAIRPSRDFHVDFAGGDWTLRIVVQEVSRNDPIARVEMLGERQRLITVSKYVGGISDENSLSPAAVAIASSVLAWEIHQSLQKLGVEVFHFEEAVRDIFLSLTWQASQDADSPGS